MLRQLSVIACLWAAATGLAHADTTALTDDKSIVTPTAWYTYANLTVAQITSRLNANQARLTDIEPYGNSGTRFAVTMVKNSGSYAVPGWFWFPALTAAQVSEQLAANNGRLIDIEPIATPSGIRFAVIMVSNTGTAARNWNWLVGVSSAQITSFLAGSNRTANPQRLTDLKSYSEGGIEKYVMISISNTGSDAKGWEWWLNQSTDDIAAKVTAFKGRITVMERKANGRYNFIQVKNTGSNNYYWRYYFGLASLTQANTVAGQFASRAFDIETYVSAGVRRYDVLMIDNASTETRRMRTAFGNTLVKPNGLPNGQWGAYLKPIGAAATIDLQGRRRFEPASAIKAVHNLAIIREIQAGNTSLGAAMTYYNYPDDTQFDSFYGMTKGLTPNACPHPFNETSGNAVASTVGFSKDNMMSASDNRTTRAITLYFGTGSTQEAKGLTGIAAIENLAFNTVGMTDTFIDQPRIGCAYDDNRRNQTTLVDMGKLYEQVENGTLLGLGSFRTEFYKPMSGDSFSSSGIEGKILAVVQAEGESLGKAQAVIDSFKSGMSWRFKPGGYSTGCDNAFTPCSSGYITIATSAGRLTLPRKVGARTTSKSYVFGHYVSDLNTCRPNAPSTRIDSCVQCPDCDTEAQRDTAIGKVREELFRTAIRENLATF